MRYIVVIPDGAADLPSPELGGKTPFEAAHKPALDAIAREGRVGMAKTVPDGLKPGSDIANLALLGYDPRTGYTGRAALEAAAQGLHIEEGDGVFRANMVTVEDGVMKDYSAGHITTAEAAEIVERLNADLKLDGVKLYPGVGYRHLCVVEGAAVQIPECKPPHDITGQAIGEYSPQGGFSSWVLEIERTSAELMPGYEVNAKRVAEGKNPATQLWLWGGATAMTLEPFKERYGLTGGMITAVDLMRGIGRLAGMDILEVEGATGYYDTNFAGKGRAALDYIYKHDFVVVHVEATDEAGHNGDAAAKVKALEDIDKHIIAPLYVMAKHFGDWRIMVLPDHPTPLTTRTHSSDPVPYAMYGPGFEASGVSSFTEKLVSEFSSEPVPGVDLMRILTQG